MSSGDSIDRSELKQALIVNEDKMTILEEGKASVEPVVDQVMELLNDSSSGDIQRHEFSQALFEVAQRNKIHLDLGGIVEAVYQDRNALPRASLRHGLVENQQFIPAIVTEGIEDQVLRHLEAVDEGVITATDLTEAISKVQRENGATMTPG